MLSHFVFCTVLSLFLCSDMGGHGPDGVSTVVTVWPHFFSIFLGPHMGHMEVPRLGVELELQLPAYTMATATRDPSRVCDLHYSSWQRWVLNL